MSRSVGIVAEFNPFHNGHKYLLEKAREAAGPDGTVISVMSGDFVQRGEPAICNKHSRAEAACKSGVNLVIELPLPWAIMSAEGFASAGVELLCAAGAEKLVFGAESDNITELSSVAELLLDPAVDALISEALQQNPEKSYAAARSDAVNMLCGKGELLTLPNNILAVEYIKALLKNYPEVLPVPVCRTGAGHDSDCGSGNIRSASYIRALAASGAELSDFVPQYTCDVINREINEGRAPVFTQNLEQAFLSSLRALSPADFDRLQDSRGGAGRRLYNAVRSSGGFEEIYASAATVRYPVSRMRRMALHAALGIDSEICALRPPYIRLLAADEKGRDYLKSNSRSFKKSLIIKPASVKTLDDASTLIFELGSAARDLYVLAYSPTADRRPGSDYRTSPVML